MDYEVEQYSTTAEDIEEIGQIPDTIEDVPQEVTPQDSGQEVTQPEDISEVTQQKVTKRFPPILESNILKALTKILYNPDIPLNEEIAANGGYIGTMDAANVCMVIAKTEESKRVLSRFVDTEKSQKIPELSYSKSIHGEIIKGKFSMAYLKNILKLMDCFNSKSGEYSYESVTFLLLKDYPLTIENEHFQVILAPRVNDD